MNTSAVIPSDMTGLPGESLLRKGLVDVAAGEGTANACLVWIAAPRLKRHGLLAEAGSALRDPELRLYAMLCKEGGNAYGRYNSLLRTLVSFEHALDRRRAARG